jgi:putative peptidoglycan lipid II flippase
LSAVHDSPAHARHLVRGFATIGAGTFVSRVSGFAREVVTAALFGVGTSMDIFVAAFTIPNLLLRIFGENALESGFMPLFRGTHARGEKHRAWRLASQTFNGLTLVLVVSVLAGIAAAPFIVAVVAHGFSGEVAAATVTMTRLMLPFGLLIGLAALMGAILLAFRRYRVYSLAPVLLNVGIVACALTLTGRLGYMSLAVGVLVGGLLQFLVQIPFARRLARAEGERLFEPRLDISDPDLRRAARLTGPVILASAIQRAGAIVDRTVASFLMPGSISSLYYSFRIVHLPYAILALAAGRSASPVLAERYAMGAHSDFREALLSGIRMNLAYLTPVVLLSVWFARPIVGLVYERGAFDASDLAMTASAFTFYSVGLVSMGLVFLLVSAFAARLNTKTPVKVAVFALVLNIVLDVLLVRTPLRHAGIALASSLAFTAHAGVLGLILNRGLRKDGVGIGRRDMLVPAGQVLLAGAALLAVVWLLDRWLGMRFAEHLTLGRVVRLVVAGGAGAIAYALVAAALGLAEVRHLAGRLRGRRAS